MRPSVGFPVGDLVGDPVSDAVGDSVGNGVRIAVSDVLGDCDRASEGDDDGEDVLGKEEGASVGAFKG